MSRGRGRGQLTFNAELLGVGRGGGLEAAPQSVLAPPPKFPPRPQRIPLLVADSEQEYLLAVRKELQTQFRASQFYIAPPPSASAKKNKYTVERYSDRFAVAKDATLNLCWKRLPKELRPETAAAEAAAKRKKRKAASTKPNMVKRKTARESEDVSMALDELEKKEAGDTKSGDEAAVSSGDEGDKEKDDDEGEKKESDLEGDGDDGDEELDGGTDYANNFFDNGEGYLDDDDDNLDEGGIY